MYNLICLKKVKGAKKKGGYQKPYIEGQIIQWPKEKGTTKRDLRTLQIELHEPHKKREVNSCAAEGQAVPATLRCISYAELLRILFCSCDFYVTAL